MIKKTVVLASALAFLVGGAVLANAEADKGPADITINADGKKPATFPHAKHQEAIKCGECHHGKDDAGKKVDYADGQKIEKCAACHTGDMLKDKVKGSTAIQRAGHGNCKACHDEQAKADPAKKDLKKCSTCHPKKK